MLELWLRGLAVGFSVAAPVGPIGILCIQRTLAHGRVAGFVTGLGAATADAVYGVLAAAGVGVVTGALVAHQGAFRLVGGAFLIYLGVRAALAAPPAAEAAPRPGGRGLAAHYAQTFLLTISNPMTILSFAAMVAALGPSGLGATTAAASASFIGGVFLGSVAWWLLLAGLTGTLRAWLLPRLRWVNVAAGVALVAFGAAITLPLVLGRG